MFEREDWKLFRNIETLSQKAGVSRNDIIRLVIKELVDNGLDISDTCKVGLIPNENGAYVQDYGQGIPEDILKDLFSINRPMITSKLLRLPSRGALGNGLRVVTGAVISSDGQLYVSTRGFKYRIVPNDDGTTTIQRIGTYEGEGTRIEVIFGEWMPIRESDLNWGKHAILFAQGERCKSKTSAYWYTSESFYELVNAYYGTIEDLIMLFEGITATKAYEISCELSKTDANELSFEESEQLLSLLRSNSKPVSAKRLGFVGDCEGSFGEYKKKYGEFKVESIRGHYDATIPYMVEAWASIRDSFAREVLVNKTPITGEVSSWYKNKIMNLYGCGLNIEIKSAKPAQLVTNITTPYMPITSDGKSPNFESMNYLVEQTLKSSVSKAKKLDIQLNNNNAKNEKDIFYNNIRSAINKASGNGEYRFSQRQLYYAIRPYIMNALDKQPDYNYFCRLLTEYENEYGDIPNLYRDPRGVLYHPHLGEEIPLGTIAVQNYERPKWTFNKILYCEKEGFFPILKDALFPERFDCALLSSKGYASRAVKDLFDLLGETDEEILFFCIHDADSAGTMIYETLQEETLTRPGRRVRVINLGLDPWEALGMGLEVEEFSSKARRPVANYVIKKYHDEISDYIEDDDIYTWEDWLQENRIELNAMTTPQFIDWLEEKIGEYDNGKVIPDRHTMKKELQKETHTIVYNQVMQKILQDNNFEEQFKKELEKVQPIVEQKANLLNSEVAEALDETPQYHWTQPIKDIAKNITDVK